MSNKEFPDPQEAKKFKKQKWIQAVDQSNNAMTAGPRV